MEPTISIRVSIPADAADVSALLESSYPELMKHAYPDTILRRALPPMVRANPKLLASGTYYVAVADDGLVVGCGGWTPEKPGTMETEPGVGHLRHFAVRSGWNGRGIGRRIYDRCETEARAVGVTVLEVYASLNAPAFYASLGFSKVGDIVVAVGRDIPFPSVWMRRSILGIAAR